MDDAMRLAATLRFVVLGTGTIVSGPRSRRDPPTASGSAIPLDDVPLVDGRHARPIIDPATVAALETQA